MALSRILYFYLWIAPHVLLLAVAFLMWRRGLHKEFPIFFSYLLFDFLQFCVLFTIYWREAWASYVAVDILGRSADIALRFGILQEMFESPLAQSAPLRRAMARTVNWVTFSLVVLALVFIGSIYYNRFGAGLLQAYVTTEALNTAQCGLLVLVFLWHRYLGFRMSPMVFGIAMGMGLAASLEPSMHAWRVSVGPSSSAPDFVQMAIYHCAVLIWLYFARVREKTPDSDVVSFLPAREWVADLGRVIHL